MRVIENIKKSDMLPEDKKELLRHVQILASLRKNLEETEYYVENYLSIDLVLRRLSDIEKKQFSPAEGFVHPRYGEYYRTYLLNAIKDDKISFKYLYNTLGKIRNNEYGYVIYDDCVSYDKDEIEYAVDFDLAEIKNQMSSIQGSFLKLNFISEKKIDSDSRQYSGELKEKLNSLLNTYRKEIMDSATLIGSVDPKANQTQTNDEKAMPPFGIRYDKEQLKKIYKATYNYIKTPEEKFLKILSGLGREGEKIDWSGSDADNYRFCRYYCDQVEFQKPKKTSEVKTISGKETEVPQKLQERKKYFTIKGRNISNPYKPTNKYVFINEEIHNVFAELNYKTQI